MGNHNAIEGLYGRWFDAIPTLLAGLAAPPPPPTCAAAADSGDIAPPSPIGEMALALDLAQRLMKSLHEALLQALAVEPSGRSFDGLGQLLQRAGWPGAPSAGMAEAMTPLPMNLERLFGGLADAFGLANTRELQQALRDITAASASHRQAQAAYLALAAGALAKSNVTLMTQLAGMAQRGETVDSVKNLVRLWARTADEALHTAMRSPSALDASARLVRSATRSRAQQQRMVAIASQALNVPTREEVDEAYREIQVLKRELRQLRKPQAPLPATLAETRGEVQPEMHAVARKRRTRDTPSTRNATAVRKANTKVRKATST